MNKQLIIQALIAFSLAVLPLLLTWFIKYDSVCGFNQNCNGGINPIQKYGWPITLREVGYYSGEKVYSQNIVNFYLFSVGVIYLFITIEEFNRNKK